MNEWRTNDERMMNEWWTKIVFYRFCTKSVFYRFCMKIKHSLIAHHSLIIRSSFAHHSLIIRSWWSFVHHSFIVRSSFAHHSLIIRSSFKMMIDNDRRLFINSNEIQFKNAKNAFLKCKIHLLKFTEKCHQRASFSKENLFFEYYSFGSLMTDVFLDWFWTLVYAWKLQKQESSWKFWSRLKILVAHCDE